MLACPALQTSSIISARWMVSKIVAPKSCRLGMRRVLVPFFGGSFFAGSNGGGCRGSDGRPSSGTAGAAAERDQHQYQPDRERECENRRLAAHSHYHCPHYRFHDARPLQRATVDDDITEIGPVAIAGVSAGFVSERGAFEMIAHELENIFSFDRNNLRAGGAGPCGADLHGLAGYDRALVSAEVSELDCPHRRWWVRSCRV
jgi:hypothetical protein